MTADNQPIAPITGFDKMVIADQAGRAALRAAALNVPITDDERALIKLYRASAPMPLSGTLCRAFDRALAEAEAERDALREALQNISDELQNCQGRPDDWQVAEWMANYANEALAKLTPPKGTTCPADVEAVAKAIYDRGISLSSVAGNADWSTALQRGYWLEYADAALQILADRGRLVMSDAEQKAFVAANPNSPGHDHSGNGNHMIWRKP